MLLLSLTAINQITISGYYILFTIACVLYLHISSQNGVKSFDRVFLLMIYLIIILGDSLGSPEFCIFINKDEKNLIGILEDPTF